MIDFLKNMIKESAVEYLKATDTNNSINSQEIKQHKTNKNINKGAYFISEIYEQGLIDIREENKLTVYRIMVKPFTDFIFIDNESDKYNPSFKVITDGLNDNIFWQRYNQWNPPKCLNDFDNVSDFYCYIYSEIEKNDNNFLKRLNKALNNNYGK